MGVTVCWQFAGQESPAQGEVTMSTVRKVSVAFLFMALVGTANASLITFSNIGDTGEIHYNGNIDGIDVEGLSAKTLFTLTEVTGNSFVFDFSMENTSDSSLWQVSRIKGVGFNVDPNISDVTTDHSSWVSSLNTSLPNGFGALEVCLSEHPEGNCGGGNGGVNIGNMVSFSLELIFSDPLPTSINLDNFGIRWQSLNSEALGYDDESGTGTPVMKVSEPGTLGLLGLGFLGVLLAARRTSR